MGWIVTEQAGFLTMWICCFVSDSDGGGLVYARHEEGALLQPDGAQGSFGSGDHVPQSSLEPEPALAVQPAEAVAAKSKKGASK